MNKDNISEFAIINRISKMFPKYKKSIIKGIGDDAAVIKINKNKYLFYTCDAQVSGEHFLEQYSSPYQIGRKAAAVNLSDIAAMGGTPKYLLVSLFLPKLTTEKFIDALYEGLSEECKKYNVNIVGGNISKSSQFIIDIFLTGEVSSKNMLFRSGAKVGDAVVVTGTIGDSAKGLQLLKQNKKKYSSQDKQFIAKHQLPIPRVKEGLILAGSGMVNSMIDLSDGLSSDIQRICDESKVGVKLFLEKLPVRKSVEMNSALNGGEDYELCFTTRIKNVKYLSDLIKKRTGQKITVIGNVLPLKDGRWLIDKSGNKRSLISKGFDHFN